MRHHWIAPAVCVLALTNVLVIGILMPAFGEAGQIKGHLYLGSQLRHLREMGVLSVDEQRMQEAVRAGELPERVREPDDLALVLGRYQWGHPLGGFGRAASVSNLVHSGLLLVLAACLWSGGRERAT